MRRAGWRSALRNGWQPFGTGAARQHRRRPRGTVLRPRPASGRQPFGTGAGPAAARSIGRQPIGGACRSRSAGPAAGRLPGSGLVIQVRRDDVSCSAEEVLRVLVTELDEPGWTFAPRHGGQVIDGKGDAPIWIHPKMVVRANPGLVDPRLVLVGPQWIRIVCPGSTAIDEVLHASSLDVIRDDAAAADDIGADDEVGPPRPRRDGRHRGAFMPPVLRRSSGRTTPGPPRGRSAPRTGRQPPVPVGSHPGDRADGRLPPAVVLPPVVVGGREPVRGAGGDRIAARRLLDRGPRCGMLGRCRRERLRE